MSNEQSKLTIQEKSRKKLLFFIVLFGANKSLGQFESTNQSIWPPII